jgi:transposase
LRDSEISWEGGEVRLKTILNRIDPLKGFVFEEQRLLGVPGELSIEIDVRPRERSRPVCSGCLVPGTCYDTLDKRRLQYVPLWGIAVFLLYAMRRVDCFTCGVKVESVPFVEGKKHVCRTFELFLAAWAKRLSWKQTAQVFRTDWKSVFRAVRSVVEWGRTFLFVGQVGVIGVDELSCGRGQKYITVVYQLDAGARRLLWVGRDRTKKTLHGFFDWLGPYASASLRAVCSDLWPAFLTVVRERAGTAVHILDPFHIAMKLSEATDKVRRQEVHRLRAQGHEPILKDSRWCLLRRPKNRTGKDKATLRRLVGFNLRSVRCMLLRWEFDAFWTYRSPTWAGKFLDGWCTKVMRSRIQPLMKVVGTLRKHRSYLLEWIRIKAKGSIPTGAVEGFNNKARVITRRAYGFRSREVMEIALYHALGKLPEPPVTHRFW